MTRCQWRSRVHNQQVRQLTIDVLAGTCFETSLNLEMNVGIFMIRRRHFLVIEIVLNLDGWHDFA